MGLTSDDVGLAKLGKKQEMKRRFGFWSLLGFATSDGTVAALEIIAEDHSWGWFHVPGWLGIINNIYACCYMIFVIFFDLWPSEYHPNAQTMNYSIVVTSGVLIFSLIWYFIRARKEYHGPIIDSEVASIVVQTH